jgi:hypothetical protein
MKFRNPFRFWPERIYSVPTLRGLIPLLITLTAGYFSFFRGSTPHQLFVVTMSFFTVIHLIESSKAMRSLELLPDPDATVFAGIPNLVRLIVTPEDSISSLSLNADFANPGLFSYPQKRVDLVAPSGLFRYWRYFEFKERAIVLPPPRDHGVPCGMERAGGAGDPDELLPIRDPRLLHLRDEKIFQKTGKSLFRSRTSTEEVPTFKLHWENLQHLSRKEAYEQISFWIMELETGTCAMRFSLSVDVPFFRPIPLRSREEMREFKSALARVAGEEALRREPHAP